jgi:dihydroflavonol-4-reductase
VPDIEAGTGVRVLVTGATGFTGQRLARALSERRHLVRALVRPTSDPGPLSAAGCEILIGDITRPADVDRAAEGVNTIYHLAALFRAAGLPDYAYRNVNVNGTRHVLDAAARHGVQRVVHCSTVGVHGAVGEVPCHEDSPKKPSDIYQATKLEAEDLAQEAFQTRVPGVVVRPVGIYGPGDIRFLKLFRAVRSGRFRMFGPGTVPYHLTYIDDLVEGIILAGDSPQALGGTYILAGEEHVSLNELVRRVAQAVGVSVPRGRLPFWPLLAAATACEAVCRPFGLDPPLHKRRVRFFLHPRAFTSEKARRELGFVPRVSLDEGLACTARWYFQRGLLAPGPLLRHPALIAR